MSLQINTYLDRDDEFRVEFIKNGKIIENDLITKVELDFPSRAFVDGQDQVVDTTTAMVNLVDNNTAVVVNLNNLPLREGTHLCRITAWDVASQSGVPWGEFGLTAKSWGLG